MPFGLVSTGGYAIGKTQDAVQMRNINHAYRLNIVNINEVFGKEAAKKREYIDKGIYREGQSAVDNANSIISQIIKDPEMTLPQKIALRNYAASYFAYAEKNRGTMDKVAAAKEQARQLIMENINPDIDTIVQARIKGNDVMITGGKIVPSKDDPGKVDYAASGDRVYYVDPFTGKRRVTSIRNVEAIVEMIPRVQAVKTAEEIEAARIIKEKERKEAPVAKAGDVISMVDRSVGAIVKGTVSDIDGNNNYIISDNQGNLVVVKPEDILPALMHVDAGTDVDYEAADGTQQHGIVDANMDELLKEGKISIAGQVLPIDNVIGVHDSRPNPLAK
ncbi:MAG: hypothetical protein LBS25_09955, partial [Candidatus Symbiothrix sp.]|nr:hypothetical protein [Candidatus Symbiothrix sp.]